MRPIVCCLLLLLLLAILISFLQPQSPPSSPTISPTLSPTLSPTSSPTLSPTSSPTISPKPTTAPTTSPTSSPTPIPCKYDKSQAYKFLKNVNCSQPIKTMIDEGRCINDRLVSINIISKKCKNSGPILWNHLPTALQHFNILDNPELSGPVFWSDLPSTLTDVNLGQNNFSGTINFSQISSSSVGLKRLFLGKNQFSGRIDFSQFPANHTLAGLGLEHNLLSGEINLQQLSKAIGHLRLSNNNFDGELKLCDWLKEGIVNFEVTGNDLIGNLSDKDYNCTNITTLEHLFLRFNHLKFDTPPPSKAFPLDFRYEPQK